MGQPIIEFKSISKQFVGVQALSHVSFSINKAEIHAIVGENGAGKSTLMNILGGQYAPTEGKIFFKGQELKIKNQNESLNLGIGIVYQELKLCKNLSVTQNIYLGQEKDERGKRLSWSCLDEKTNEVIKQLGGKFSASDRLDSLSLAEQQLVEIARTLCRKADVIVMDEPTSSLTVKESENLFAIIRKLKTEGKTIIYISHRMNEVFALSDRISILRDGKFLGTFKSSEITHDEVISYIAGKEMAENESKRNIRTYSPQEKPVLEVSNLSREGKFSDIDLKVFPGEILGIYGLQGAGRTEILESLFGLCPPTNGEIKVNGNVVVNKTPHQAITNGFAMISENRLRDGFFPKLSIQDNVCSVQDVPIAKGLFKILDREKMSCLCQKVIDDLSVHAFSQQQLISQLSGGNQQKAIIGKWLTSNPKILLVDEPSRGVDVGAKAEIFDLLKALSKQGIAILLVSSELEEIISQSNRVIVMKEGRFLAEFDAKEVTKEKIIKIAI